jgi:hypothetical protein
VVRRMAIFVLTLSQGTIHRPSEAGRERGAAESAGNAGLPRPFLHAGWSDDPSQSQRHNGLKFYYRIRGYLAFSGIACTQSSRPWGHA